MGSRMAGNILRNQQDREIIIFNRTQDKATSLINNGALWADNPKALGQQVDILFTMLSNPEAVTNVALGENGFLDTLAPGTLWVDCSTVHPSFSRQMAQEAGKKQVRFLDAPVAGSKNQAENAKLVFFIGGDLADVKTCQPLFELWEVSSSMLEDMGWELNETCN